MKKDHVSSQSGNILQSDKYKGAIRLRNILQSRTPPTVTASYASMPDRVTDVQLSRQTI